MRPSVAQIPGRTKHEIAQWLARPVAGVDGKLELKSWRRPRGPLALEEITASKVSTREILSLEFDAHCVTQKATFQKCTFGLLPSLLLRENFLSIFILQLEQNHLTVSARCDSQNPHEISLSGLSILLASH